jgi:hypothetical protein
MSPAIEPLGDGLIRLEFAGLCKMFLHERFVATIWPHGVSLCADIEAVGNLPGYHEIAAACGYSGGNRGYARYARHHELVHNWLGAEHGRLSQTLYAAAQGQRFAGWEAEEHLVNCLQRLWADWLDGIAWRRKELAAAEDALGRDWPGGCSRLFQLLNAVP